MGKGHVKPKKPRVHIEAAYDRPYENLAIAIIAQAISDAEALMRGQTVFTSRCGRLITVEEMLRFFHSKWCDVLLGTTGFTGEDVAERIGFYDFIGR